MRQARGVQFSRGKISSNKLITIAFETSLGCIVVMQLSVDSRITGTVIECRNTHKSGVSTLLSERKVIYEFIAMMRFRTVPWCRKNLFI